ncbi:MAG: hypothetical protein KJO07_12750, partial [Deltaproteobacteria bacterium]|nr:hypothetical protein [Deltaproteobacteria bacterium]
PRDKRRSDTHDLLNSLIEQDRKAKRASGSPMPFAEEATKVVGLDAEKFMAAAEAGGHRQVPPDEPTQDIDFEQMIAEDAAPAPRVFADSVKLHSPDAGASPNPDVYSSSDEATRAVDVGRLADLEKKRATTAAGVGESVHEDPTRQIDLGKERLDSLSDIDFDLD